MDSHRDPLNEHSSLRIVHSLPGRLRFRGPARAGSEALAEAIGGLAGVRSCMWSPRTRSILVLFEPEAIAAEAITHAVALHAGIDENLVVDLAQAQPIGVRHGRATFASGVAETFGELDRRVRRSTRGLMGLGALMPLTLTVWAAREIALGRAAPLAWSTALWYAHGLFRDYNTPPTS
jgi:hypothetical protein